MDGLDLEMQIEGPPSMMGTGGGTDHDDASIRARPEYRWEGVLSDPVQHDRRRRRKFFSKLGAWFGVNPLWKANFVSPGVSVDVYLQDGFYHLRTRE